VFFLLCSLTWISHPIFFPDNCRAFYSIPSFADWGDYNFLPRRAPFLSDCSPSFLISFFSSSFVVDPHSRRRDSGADAQIPLPPQFLLTALFPAARPSFSPALFFLFLPVTKLSGGLASKTRVFPPTIPHLSPYPFRNTKIPLEYFPFEGILFRLPSVPSKPRSAVLSYALRRRLDTLCLVTDFLTFREGAFPPATTALGPAKFSLSLCPDRVKGAEDSP